jgi:hypothetical protein
MTSTGQTLMQLPQRMRWSASIRISVDPDHGAFAGDFVEIERQPRSLNGFLVAAALFREVSLHG